MPARVNARPESRRRLDKADRETLVRRYHREGLNDSLIARQTGMCSRTVLRIRQRLNLPAVTR